MLTIVQSGAGVRVRSHLRLYRTIPAIRSFTEVENMSAKPITLTYVSSFALTGLCKEGLLPWDEKAFVWIPSNSWGGEAQWRRNPIRALGMTRVEGISTVKDPQCMQNFSMKRIQWLANGTWGSGEYLPMGSVENAETGEVLTWQIEHHAAWHAEISDTLGQLYLRLSGPTDQENQWAKTLLPHERFCSVPCCITAGQSFSDTISTLTAYRRLIRRDHWDNHTLPVVFNDYMNCLYGDPTTEKLLPVIDAAAHVGCEVFCIDCGWYADGPWWDGVGQWLPSQKRFPNGIEEPISYIRQKGMIPGLWLELEVMGVKCELASVWEDACFFVNHGKRV
ncbi:MAG: alpha-galactosidase, partial [Clostridia bacterium]